MPLQVAAPDQPSTSAFLSHLSLHFVILDLKSANWTTLVLGTTIVDLEAGSIYMFRAGWDVSATDELVGNPFDAARLAGNPFGEARLAGNPFGEADLDEITFGAPVLVGMYRSAAYPSQLVHTNPNPNQRARSKRNLNHLT